MTRTLPANAIALLAGRSHADAINVALNVAYWMHGRDDHCALHQLNWAHDQFAELALAMGYTITPIAASAEENAA